MPFLAWTSSLEVGIRSIDSQHKKLIELINRLHDAMKEGNGKDVLGPILSELTSYTFTHFRNEEELFREHRYHEAVPHKKEHDGLRKQVEELKKKFDAGEVTLSMEVMSFLREWLQKHILGSDKRYAPYLKKQGVQ